MDNKKRRANGEGYWGEKVIKGITYIRYTKRYDGKPKDFYGKTRSEVKKKVIEFEIKGRAVSTTSIQKMSFYMYCRNWLFFWKRRKIKDKTKEYYYFIIESFIKDSPLGIMQLKYINKLSQETMENKFNDYLRSYCNTLSRSTINNGIYTVVSQVNKYAVDKKDIVFNFTSGVEKVDEDEVKKKKIIKQALTYEQIMILKGELLRKVITKGNQKEMYVYGIGSYALLFICYTGLRWGEVSCLRWSDINMKDKRFEITKQFINTIDFDELVESNFSIENVNHINKEDVPKSEKSTRTIPINDEALNLLEMVKERYSKYFYPEHLIFSTSDKQYSDSNANRLLKKACIKAQIPLITTHELRHSFASILLNYDEKELYTVSSLLGHSNSDVTYNTYIHIFEQKKADALNIFSNINKEEDENTKE